MFAYVQVEKDGRDSTADGFSFLTQGGTGFAGSGVQLKAKEARPVMQAWEVDIERLMRGEESCGVV